jgi:hypothetical protein
MGRDTKVRAWTWAVAFAASAVAAPAAFAATVIPGTFALPGETAQSTASLSFVARSATSARLDLTLREPGGAVIADYERRPAKALAIVVVSSDLGDFRTLDPGRPRDGHFAFDLTVPKTGVYYLYADAQPRNLGQQAFRFDLHFGSGGATSPAPPLPVPGSTAAVAGPYTVTLSSLTLASGKPTLVRVHVAAGLKPATDLRPSAGTVAGVALVSEKTLAFGKAHAFLGAPGAETNTLPDNASVPADFNVMLTPPAPGAYRLWVQFKGGDRAYVAPFALTAP